MMLMKKLTQTNLYAYSVSAANLRLNIMPKNDARHATNAKKSYRKKQITMYSKLWITF